MRSRPLTRRLSPTSHLAAATTLVVVVVGVALSWTTIQAERAAEVDRTTADAGWLAELVIVPALDDDWSDTGRDGATVLPRGVHDALARTTSSVASVAAVRAADGTVVAASGDTSVLRVGNAIDTVDRSTRVVEVVDGGEHGLGVVVVPLRDGRGTVVGDVVVGVPLRNVVTGVRGRLAIHLAIITVGLAVVLTLLHRSTMTAHAAMAEVASVRTHAATHDDLTGLPNRAQLVDRIIATLESRDESTSATALLLLDLDRFKQVNDALGHDKGDELLEQVATRLADSIHRADVLARLGGDEFAVLVPEVRDRETANRTAERLAQALDAPFTVAGVEVTISASVGVSVVPFDATHATDLLRHADMAMYAAKRAGVPVAAYESDGTDHPDVDQLSLLGRLRRAIEEDELVLHYQPQLELETGRIAGVEALVRWQHPTRGLLGPWAFIDLAEQSGLMGPMTTWVLESAAHQLRMWDEAGIDLSIAINVSPRTLVEPGFAGRIFTSLARWGVDPTRLELEITEHELVEQADLVAETLARIRSLGVRVAIDDFGTGYSSLSYLTALPVDVLKIDRSLVASFEQDEGQSTVLRAVAELAHALDMAVVAEGVEQYDTLTALHRLGVDLAQGYALWRPAPADEVTSLLLGTPSSAPQPHGSTRGSKRSAPATHSSSPSTSPDPHGGSVVENAQKAQAGTGGVTSA